MTKTFIVAYARTPIGKMSGALASFDATALGGFAIAGALQRAAGAGLTAADVDHVIMGQVLQAGAGQNPARQAAANGGIPLTVPAITVNKVCLSGLNSIHLADQMIRAGDADVVIAGGMESMTNAPYLLPGARAGYRLGDAAAIDSLIADGLWCAFDGVHMGEATDRYAAAAGIARRDQDEFAAWSHERAATAVKEGHFDAEIVAVEVPQRKGPAILVDADEGIRPGTTADSLGRLKPAFSPAPAGPNSAVLNSAGPNSTNAGPNNASARAGRNNAGTITAGTITAGPNNASASAGTVTAGTVTAGNASQLSDGAGAVILVSEAKAKALAAAGLTTKAELVGYGMVAGPDPSLLTQPAAAIQKALHHQGLTIADVDLFEINEAFAAVALASMNNLGISPMVVNINGGALALGHPIGMSGTRLVITMIEELNRRGGGLGAVALCGGGGQGDAALLRVA